MPSLSEITPYITASFSCAAVAELRETPKEKILTMIVNKRGYVAFSGSKLCSGSSFLTQVTLPF